MKLAKVEEKYVSVFKENRSLAKDRDTFIEFVKVDLKIDVREGQITTTRNRSGN